MVLLYGELVCALEVKILFLSFFGKTASIFGERGNLSIVSCDFLHMEILFENCLFTFLLAAPTQRQECHIVKGCRVSKTIQCATVHCPRQ